MTTAITREMGLAIARRVDANDGLSFDQLVAIGDKLVRTGFLPDHVKTGAQAAAIVMAGRELGMPMMRAIRSITLVKGNVTEDADSQLARFKTDGGKSKFTTLTTKGAVLWLRHPNGDEHTEEFGVDEARAAGLLSSTMYTKFPKAMFRSRAITAGLKSLGWEGGCSVYYPGEIPGTDRAPEARQVPEARPSPSPEVERPLTAYQEDHAAEEPREPPPKTVAEVLAWIASAPKAPASDADETETLADVAAWIREHQKAYLPHDVQAFRAAYTARIEAES